MKNFDVIIIGGGAAGLMCAAVAGLRGRKVLLIEHNEKVGDKIRISGGGRCNFTNLDVTAKNFISKNPHFCVSALQRFTSRDFIKMVEEAQISYHEKTLGQLFCDKSSQQIIDMLLTKCSAGGVEIMLETSVKSVQKNADKFLLTISQKGEQDAPQQVLCQSLVIATGGLSIPKMGATGFGYDVARQFGLKIVETYPALVPLTLEESTLAATKSLSGVAVDAEISKGKPMRSPGDDVKIPRDMLIPLVPNLQNRREDRVPTFREAMLFTHRGLSGPAILQISSYLQKGDEVLINMAPNHNIYTIFLQEKSQKPKQEISTILAKYLPKSLANYIAQSHNCQGWIADYQNQKLKEIAASINAYSLTPSGTEGYAKAEVTGGGIDTDEVSSKTFECKNVPGLYFIGEVLDVTGHLGGFNFQFAWSSGHAAAQFV